MTDSHWTAMFEQSRHVGGAASPPAATAPARPAPEADDIELAPDMTVYRPWILQRGRTSPAMMLDLRRYEPRSGMWSGWAMSYPHLVALEYTGDRLLSLDFGQRQFALEGVGLDELAHQIQRGTVLSVHQFSVEVWPLVGGPCVAAIRQIGASKLD